MLALVQLIVNHGGTYSRKASENDIFVRYDEKDEAGNERYCSRLKYVTEAIENGKLITLVSWKQLLDILGVSEENLSTMPEPDKKSFFVRNPFENNFHIESKRTTIGDILKSKGVDLTGRYAVNQ